jgi:uncharacterized protein
MRLGGLLAGAAAVLVWYLSPELAWPARAWLAVLLGPLPVLMIAQARQLGDLAELPRRDAYLSSMASLWLLAGLTVAAARFGGIDRAAMGFVPVSAGAFLGWTAGLTAGGVAVLFAFRALGMQDGMVVRQLMPETPRERATFVALSITAGITEETVFRGFVLHALLLAAGSWPIALLLSSGVFGVVHAYQQPAGALRAALLGGLLAIPLLMGGSIYTAMAAHALIDVLSGLWLARYLLR